MAIRSQWFQSPTKERQRAVSRNFATTLTAASFAWEWAANVGIFIRLRTLQTGNMGQLF